VREKALCGLDTAAASVNCRCEAFAGIANPKSVDEKWPTCGGKIKEAALVEYPNIFSDNQNCLGCGGIHSRADHRWKTQDSEKTQNGAILRRTSVPVSNRSVSINPRRKRPRKTWFAEQAQRWKGEQIPCAQ
jgi:hypothetical protein